MNLQWNKTSKILPQEYKLVILHNAHEIPLDLSFGFYETAGGDCSPSWCMNDSGDYYDLSYYEYWADISSINLPE